MKTLIIILSLISFSASANSYYFSNTGSDANLGTFAAPFQTLNRYATGTFATNDTFYFKRGDTYYGNIKVKSNGHKFLSYGTGNAPVITGFETLTGWTSVGGGIYQTTCTNCKEAVKICSVNDEQKGMGRWPNSGVNYIATANSSYFTDTTLSRTNSTNWAGAHTVIRKRYWIWDVDSITSMNGDTIRYSLLNTTYPATSGYGYFIENHISTLDSLHEWFYNHNTKVFSMYFGGNTPSSYTVKVSTVDTLVTVNSVDNITLRSIKLEGSNKIGISLYGTHNFTLDSSEINMSGTDAIWGKTKLTDSSSYITIKNSTINNTNNNGINLEPTFHHYTILNNNILNTNMIVGMGMSADNAGNPVVTNGPNGLTKYNTVRNSAYHGIRWGGDSSIVTRNFVDSVCISKSDGAGIYTYVGFLSNPVYRREVSYNIITNVLRGDAESTPQHFVTYGHYLLSMGIYTDVKTQNLDIHHNTVYNSDWCGVYILASRDIKIYQNKLMNNTNMIYYSGAGDDSLRYIIATNNTLLTLNGQKNFNTNTAINPTNTNLVDSNYYATPYNQAPYPYGDGSLGAMRSTTGYELHSVQATKTAATTFFDYNPSENIKKVWLDGTWYDAAGKAYSNTIFIEPYGCVMLMKINQKTKLNGLKIKVSS